MDIFKDNQADDYHVFVSDSKWMKELGLATFTTGILYDWWYAQDERKEYMNRPFVKHSTKPVPEVFFKKGGGGVVDGSAEVWRFTGPGKGKYEEQSFGDTWSYTDEREEGDNPSYGANWGFGEINIDYFDGVKYLAPSINLLEGSLVGLLTDPDRFGPELPSLDSDGNPTARDVVLDGIKNVTNIIALNDWVRAWEVQYPDKKDVQWDKKALARYEFIEDIRTSKLGCLTYNVSVEFDVAPGQTFETGRTGAGKPIRGAALKTEDFTIKLYLYDDRSIRSTGKIAILTSTKHSAIPRDDLGRVGTREDGEIEEGGTDSSEEVTGDIDLSLSQKTGNWKSGNKQILAKIVDEVSSATWVGDVEALKEADITGDILADPDNPLHLVMGTGTAMPISMQNGNPLQWTPNYAQPKSCRKDDKTKVILNVKNPSDKVFKTNTTVLLNEVNDEWMPMDFGSGLASDETVITSSFEGRWDFTYFATSLKFFFRDEDNHKVTPEQAERAFHVAYYDNSTGTDTLNWAANEADNPHYPNAKPFIAEHGYHQFSSFDFMDNDIGGTRGGKRSLGATVWGRDPVGTNINDPFGLESGPFFGCVFPLGYRQSDDNIDRHGANDYVDDRSWDVKGKQGSDLFFNSDLNGVVIPSRGTIPMKDLDNDKHAYIEGPENTDGKQIPMFTAAELGNFSASHLPADIATNCSPVGFNGRPISNMAYLGQVHGASGSELRDYIRDTYFNKVHNWLYKAKYWDGADDNTIGYTKDASYVPYTGGGYADDSAFDFNPLAANKIQFRPLKMEVYASLVEAGQESECGILSISPAAQDEGRAEIWYKVARKMDDGLAPASDSSRLREQTGLGVANPLYRDGLYEEGSHFGSRDPHKSYGLGWNVDYGAELFKTNNNSSRFSQGPVGGHFQVGQNSFMMDPQEPAGAVGVIGAIATVSAASYISFFTTQIIGMQGDFGGAVAGTVPGWLLGFGGTSSRTTWLPTWGGPSLSYDDFQTTDLSVKIYQAWPREQTIYDPRFFAVHHFNNGVTLSDTVKTTPEDTNGNDLPDHNIDVAESTVDTREPSFVTVDNQTAGDTITAGSLVGSLPSSPEKCPAGTKTFKKGVLIGGAYHPLLPSGQWNINPQRRGKLLPFQYEYNAALIPWEKDDVIHLVKYSIYPVIFSQSDGVYFSGGLPQNNDIDNNYIDDPATTVVETKSVQAVKMVIQDLGHDYLKGDQFKVLGSDAVFEVEVVDNMFGTSGINLELRSADNPTGDKYEYHNTIQKMKVTDRGTYFDNNKLLPTGDASVNPVKSSTQGSAKLVPLHSASVNGKGFKAYMTQAVVSTTTAIDAKPKIATAVPYWQLSVPSDNTPGGVRDGNIPITQGDRHVQADIDPYAASADGLYDLFFHFHNDVSHTWMTNDFGNTAQNRDQFIDLTILPV